MKQVFTIAAAALAASLALAQAPGLGPRPGLRQPDFAQLKTFLSLTDAQVTQLQEAQKQLHSTNRSTFEQLAAKEKSLRETLSGGTTDAAAVGRMVLEIEALRKQLKTSRENAVTNAVALLTAPQRTNLAELEAASKLAPAIGQAHALNLLSGPERDVLIMGPHFEAGPLHIGAAASAEPTVVRRIEIRH
jgi:Spy/CpxP family protein refolding chaperone